MKAAIYEVWDVRKDIRTGEVNNEYLVESFTDRSEAAICAIQRHGEVRLYDEDREAGYDIIFQGGR